jgi:hypothetical protein
MAKVDQKAVLSTSPPSSPTSPDPYSTMENSQKVEPCRPDYILTIAYMLLYLELAWLITFIWRYSRD